MANYGNPASGSIDQRPRCWGLSYDNEHPECRRCSFQNSCRDHIIRTRQAQQAYVPATQPSAPMVTPTTYFSQFQPAHPQPYPLQTVPVQYAQPPAPTVVPVFRPPAPPPPHVAPRLPATAPPAPPVMGGPPSPGYHQEVYGRFQDPMYWTVAAAPSPFRPQWEGEAFHERVFKNAALAAGEAVVGQFFLALRQIFWFPQPAVQQRTVDSTVTPPGVP